MNPLWGFKTARGHPFATDRHPLTGISHPAHHRLYRYGTVHQSDAGVGDVAVEDTAADHEVKVLLLTAYTILNYCTFEKAYFCFFSLLKVQY